MEYDCIFLRNGCSMKRRGGKGRSYFHQGPVDAASSGSTPFSFLSFRLSHYNIGHPFARYVIATKHAIGSIFVQSLPSREKAEWCW